MKKIINLAIALFLSMGMLAACGGASAGSASIPENPGNIYRVVVTDESGAPVQGVVIQFCSDMMCLMGETDADGIAPFENQEEGAYTVHVFDVPEGFAEDETVYDAPENFGDVNITLKKAQ